MVNVCPVLPAYEQLCKGAARAVFDPSAHFVFTHQISSRLPVADESQVSSAHEGLFTCLDQNNRSDQSTLSWSYCCDTETNFESCLASKDIFDSPSTN